MKKLIYLLCIISLVSCGDKKDSTEVTTSSDSTTTNAAADNIEYAYTLKEPHADWQPGDKQHAANVLRSLKAYETGNISEAVSYFGDSVTVRFDGFEQKMSRDSLLAFFTHGRNMSESVTIEMHDWESVRSKDGKLEWVTLWYKQKWKEKGGKIDSLAIVDDAKIVNGKIVELNEAQRRYPAKMK